MTNHDVPPSPRRSLILAGGGLKVAAQAGALQVWLDEARLDFDHADGTSGGVFNLAMWCQGMSGTRIADNWRNYRPLTGVSPNLLGIALGPLGPSLFTLRRQKEIQLPRWGLDWTAIRRTERSATFNVYDFTHHRLEVVEAAEMTDDLLMAAITLPIWFPPVKIADTQFIDALFATDANIEEAIRRGADEIWVIWTVSRTGRWRWGWINQYFQIIETCANGRLQLAIDRIERNNDLGDKGEFARPIKIRLLEIKVPLHYLLNFRASKFPPAVELGVREARAWCREREIELPPPVISRTPGMRGGIRFHERITGTIVLGESDPKFAPGASGKKHPIALELDVHIPEIGRFLADPKRLGEVSGIVMCQALGGRLPLVGGTIELLEADSDESRVMKYILRFRDLAEHPLTLVGIKNVRDDPGLDLWPDITVVFTRVLFGHYQTAEVAAAIANDDVVAAGILEITPWAALRLLVSFRAQAPTLAARLRVLATFLRFYLGALRSVYLTPGRTG